MDYSVGQFYVKLGVYVRLGCTQVTAAVLVFCVYTHKVRGVVCKLRSNFCVAVVE